MILNVSIKNMCLAIDLYQLWRNELSLAIVNKKEIVIGKE
jgi:hypothetical protein